MLSDMQKRILLFLFGCMTVRILFVVIAKKVDPEFLPILGFLSLLPAIGFAYLFITHKRLTGPEVFGGKIWWTDLRPVHSLLYLAFAVCAIHKKSYSWVFLAADVLLGFIGFVVYHYSQGDFKMTK
jgi:hypothetical protein